MLFLKTGPGTLVFNGENKCNSLKGNYLFRALEPNVIRFFVRGLENKYTEIWGS